MLTNTLARGSHEQRLRLWLSFIFIALALPAGVLVWQAYSQLKWEAFHQYRGMAEELTDRINTGLVSTIAAAEARSFADYSFLVVSGDPTANLLQQSPLSMYPVAQELPGLLGYFQVDSQGEFSTPLLPTGGNPPVTYGISTAEYAQRQALAEQLQAVLSSNQLVEHRTAPEAALADYAAGQESKSAGRQSSNSQLAFDKLKQAASPAYSRDVASADVDDAAANSLKKRERDQNIARVADLKLDSALEEKSAELELSQERRADAPKPAQYPQRIARKEQISVAEPEIQAAGAVADAPGGKAGLRISTFESEIDPLEFSRLDSGHFVLFRKVWRDKERFIQGMLLAQDLFTQGAIDRPFQQAALASMSEIIVAYQGDVLSSTTGGQSSRYRSGAGELDGALLYRARLTAPFNSLEVIYTIKQLPPGPGAPVLAWVSLVLGLVLCSGFYALYRMGLGQIRLARQQQDFVSAVSHELKTPLTSIRMYSEMLKEGWAADDKKQTYYTFIHDESERLTRLISNVLQLANIGRSEPQLDLKPVSVGEVLGTIETKVASQVQRAEFELQVLHEPAVDSAVISIDLDRFAQIIINLVDNAIKFSRGAQQRRIEIGARLRGNDQVVFTVRDFGPGIPKDQMRKIFDMFYRSESELTRETVGTGIGLAIVHQLCTAMKASVDVLNRDPGAEFLVSVPLSPNRTVD